MTESYDKLYKIYSESKNSEINKGGNIQNKDLIISKLNLKIQDLSIENDRINKKYLECSRELERLNMHLKFNFVSKAESENKINEYKYKLKHFENESIKIKEEIKSLRKENEKLIEQKEYFEGQINNELNNINNNENNDLIEEEGNEEEEIESCKNLENLIMNCEENETEEAPEENKEEKIEINNIDKKTENQITINKKDNNILENKISGGSINNNNKSSSLKTKSIRIKTNEHNSKEINLKKSVNFNELKTKKVMI